MEYKILAEQTAELQAGFSLYDSGTGHISTMELRTLILAFGQDPSPSELKSIISIADTKYGGQVDFQFFVNTMAKLIGECDSEEELQLALRKLDKDKDGYIPESDLVASLTRFGVKDATGIVNAMKAQPGVSVDGFIYYPALANS